MLRLHPICDQDKFGPAGKCDHSVQLTESGLVKQPSIQRRALCENHDPFDGQVKDCIRSHCDSAAASSESSD